jgi:hypothetical protein
LEKKKRERPEATLRKSNPWFILFDLRLFSLSLLYFLKLMSLGKSYIVWLATNFIMTYTILLSHFMNLLFALLMFPMPSVGRTAHLFFFFYSYVHTMFGSSLPPSPTPSLFSTPSLFPTTPHYQAETILPLSLILLKREYKQQ